MKLGRELCVIRVSEDSVLLPVYLGSIYASVLRDQSIERLYYTEKFESEERQPCATPALMGN